MAYEPKQVGASQQTQEFNTLARIGGDLATIRTWDADLLREPRVCVPIDLQGLVVPAGDPAGSEGVRLTGPLSPGRDLPGEEAHDRLAGPDPFAEPTPRAPGVHLHWALPDALLEAPIPEEESDWRTRPTDGPDAGGGGLDLPALPDRWLVLRLLAPAGGSRIVPRGWVLDAAAARAWPLELWQGDPAGPGAAEIAKTAAVPAEGLTGAAGGTLTWTAGYDAAAARFAFHDGLEDLAADPALGGALPGGAFAGRATYLVSGWWSRPDLDPLDPARSQETLDSLLESLGWRLPSDEDAGGEGQGELWSEEMPDPVAKQLGIPKSRRFGAAPGKGSRHAPLNTGKDGAMRPVKSPPAPSHASTLLHGAVVGVPVAGQVADRVRAADLRPDPGTVEVGLGESMFDTLAALTAGHAGKRVGVGDPEELAIVERLIAALAQHTLHRLAEPGGAAEIDEDLHAAGFETVGVDEAGVVDRLVDGRTKMPSRERRIGKVSQRATRKSRRTFALATGATRQQAKGKLIAERSPLETSQAAKERRQGEMQARESIAAGAEARTTIREEERPAPPRHVPSDPFLAVRGARRSLRHRGDGRWRSDNKLLVRHPSQLMHEFREVLHGADVIAPLGSGAVPPEATALAREAVLVSPHLTEWLAERAAERSGSAGGGAKLRLYRNRLEAEHLLRYDDRGAFSNRAGPESALTAVGDPSWRPGDRDADPLRTGLLARENSIAAGDEPSPVGMTAWAQPWVPLWLEFSAEVRSVGASAAIAADWSLGQIDLDPAEGAPDPAAAPAVVAVSSRVPLTSGIADVASGAAEQHTIDEEMRDVRNAGESDEAVEEGLAALVGIGTAPDLLGANLGGVRRRLLGLPARDVVAKDAAGNEVRPSPDALPHLLASGTIRVTAARLLDCFGRVLDLDPDAAAVPQRLAVTGAAGSLLRRPRFTAPSRLRLRLVEATASHPSDAVDARVDEAEPERQVNPIAGFLLPDHADESLELFATDGSPLGELLVAGAGGPRGGGVVWEPAPGRAVPSDAPPGLGLAPAQRCLEAFATGLVGADAAQREGGRAGGGDSALSALLRAIDTTLWSVDPTAGAGSAQGGAIVGQPIAVVRAVLELDVADDLEALELDAKEREQRAAAYSQLVEVGVRVRLGEITRPDDGLLAWFADDDFSRARLVDAAVADLARASGPGKGHFGAWGTTPVDPEIDPLRNPYLVTDDKFVLRPGMSRLVTLLMAPGAAVHLTSGIGPRSRTALSRGWFAAGLDRLVPSIRVGPVLVDPEDIRLPPTAALGDRQTLSTRDGPLGWRDDAILAASADATLPDHATVLREGWIRVTPEAEDERGG